MTPYYQDEWATIYHGDEREILPSLLDDLPLIIADPPYGIEFRYGDSDFRDSEEEFISLIKPLAGNALALLQYPEEMMRLVCPILGAPSEVMAWIYNSNLPRQTRLWGFWNQEVDFNRVKQPCKNPDVKKVLNPLVSSYDWIEFQQVKGNGRDKTPHPCQLPIGLVSHVIRICDPSAIVDPFMGSGTTLRAAKDLRIPSVGIERQERFCEIAAQRLAQEVLAL